MPGFQDPCVDSVYRWRKAFAPRHPEVTVRGTRVRGGSPHSPPETLFTLVAGVASPAPGQPVRCHIPSSRGRPASVPPSQPGVGGKCRHQLPPCSRALFFPFVFHYFPVELGFQPQIPRFGRHPNPRVNPANHSLWGLCASSWVLGRWRRPLHREREPQPPEAFLPGSGNGPCPESPAAVHARSLSQAPVGILQNESKLLSL